MFVGLYEKDVEGILVRLAMSLRGVGNSVLRLYGGGYLTECGREVKDFMGECFPPSIP